MQITEPVTMLTDYALGVVNLVFALNVLFTIHAKNKVTALLLGLGFLGGAVSGFAGGTFHGFAAHFNDAERQRLWNTTLLAIGTMGAFLGSGIHAAHVDRKHGMRIVSAIVVTVIGLFIQLSGFRAHQPFNHNDIFHVIQIVAMILFFRGSRDLLDRAYSPK